MVSFKQKKSVLWRQLGRPSVNVGLLCCAVLVATLFVLARNDGLAEEEAARNRIQSFEDRVAVELSWTSEPLDELARFYRASEDVSRDEFRAFTLRRHGISPGSNGSIVPLVAWFEMNEERGTSLARVNGASVRAFGRDALAPEFLALLERDGARFFRQTLFPDSAFKQSFSLNPNDLLVTRVTSAIKTKQAISNGTAIGASEAVAPVRGFIFGTINLSAALRSALSASPDFGLVDVTLIEKNTEYPILQSLEVDSTEADQPAVLMSRTIAGYDLSMRVRPNPPPNRLMVLQRHALEFGVLLLGSSLIVLLTWLSEARGRQANKARANAERANDQKSRFLATMSHEIRTPLNGILGMSDLVQKGELSERQRTHLITLNKSAEALLGIINAILDFSKIESEQIDITLEEIDLSELLDQVVRNANVIAASKGVEVLLEYSWTVPRRIVTDGMRLRQILTNLMSNSVKFTSDGYVALRVFIDETAPATDGQQTLVFEVKDSGIGIPPNKLETIFKPFLQADTSTTRDYGGTGLGLSITDELVGLMGGRIDVSSVIGEGSQFSVRLPVETIANSGQYRREIAVMTALRYLVLAENETLRDATTRLVETMGGEVACATTISEAEQLIAEKLAQHEPFDFVLMDKAMLQRNAPNKLSMSVENFQPLLIEIRSSRDAHLARELDSADGISATIAFPILAEHFARRISHAFRKSFSPNISDRVTLPALPKVQSAPADLAGANILLVEDDRVNQMYAEELLENLGCNVMTCENGQLALKALETYVFDVVLMDCQMPVMDGFTAATQIKADVDAGIRPKVPVIALTANAVKGDRQRCIDAGMDDYVTKPVRESQLLTILNHWLPKRDPANAAAVTSEDPIAEEGPDSSEAVAVDEVQTAPSTVEDTPPAPTSREPEPEIATPATKKASPNPLDTMSSEARQETVEAEPSAPLEQPSDTASAAVEAIEAATVDDVPTLETIQTAVAQEPTPLEPAPNQPPAPDAHSEEEPLEFAADVFANARDSMGKRFDHLVNLFVEDGEVYIEQLKDAVSKQDMDTCVRVAHTFKSTSKLLGASKLSAEALKVERMAKSSDTNPDEIADVVAGISVAFTRTLTHIRTSM